MERDTKAANQCIDLHSDTVSLKSLALILRLVECEVDLALPAFSIPYSSDIHRYTASARLTPKKYRARVKRSLSAYKK